MKGDGKFLPLVIIGLVFVLVFALSRSVSFISPLSPISFNVATTTPGNNLFNVLGEFKNPSHSSTNGTSNGGNTTGTNETPLSERVSLQAGNASYESDPAKEYITLQVRGNGSPISISGWQLETDRTTVSPSQSVQTSKSRVTIPLGTALPLNYAVNNGQPIVLESGQHAIITTGESPRTYPASLSISFQTNKCSGYFTGGDYTFSPYLSAPSCPWASNEVENVSSLEDACVNYIKGLSGCTDPMLKQDKKINLFSNQCREFILRTFNYRGCVTLHKDDQNFYGDEWRIYLDRTQELWKKGDVIRLLDSEGNEITRLTLSY